MLQDIQKVGGGATIEAVVLPQCLWVLMSLSFPLYTNCLLQTGLSSKPDQLEIIDLTITLSHYLYEVLLEPGEEGK